MQTDNEVLLETIVNIPKKTIKHVERLLNFIITLQTKINDKMLLIDVLQHVLPEFVHYINVLNNNQKLFVLLKGQFEQFINIDNMKCLIPIYNKIFKDHTYKNTNKYDTHNLTKVDNKVDIDDINNTNELIINEELVQKLTKLYHASVERKQFKETTPLFKKGEIIGAKDKNGNWWMSRVLHIFTYNQHHIYYIEFLGWGDHFNEFIADKYRLARYNPYKHAYYREANVRK